MRTPFAATRGVAPIRQDRSSRTLSALLAAARAALVADGWEGATVAAVASSAGVAVGSVYRRFRNKDALFAAAFETYYADSYERRRRALADSAADNLPSALRFVVTELVVRTRENAPFLRTYWTAGLPRDPATRKRIDGVNERGFDQIAAHVAAFAPDSPATDVRFALQCVAQAIRGRFIYPAAQPLSVPLSDDAFIDALVRMCLGFLSPARRKSMR